nr:TldD/PmbA family protein [Nanoarchaeum sp.]
MSKELAEFALKYLKEKEVDYAEVRLEKNSGSGMILNNSNLEMSGFDQETGLGVRFLIKNNLGFVAINQLEKEKIKQELEKSIRLTKRAAKISERVLFSSNKAIKKSIKIKQKQILDEEQKLKYIKEIDKEVNTNHKYFSLTEDLIEKYYINTEGAQIAQTIPRLHFFYFLTILNGANSIQRNLQFGSTTGFEALKKWKIESHLQTEIKALRENLEHGIKAPTGELDVVFGPEVTGIATHESIGHPYEADRIFGREAAQAGESFVTQDMLNTRIGSEVVTAVDDPTLADSYGFYLYDDEGTKAYERVLMKNGIINQFLHDRQTAEAMQIKSNGSARASVYSVEPMVRMANTFVKPGKNKEEDLFKEIKKGIYIKSFMEWNIDDKRFSQKYTGDEAYLIENGEITKPVKHPSIEITTPKLWSSVDMVANNLQFFAASCGKGEPMQGIPVFTGGPSIRLRKIMMH